MVTSNSATPAVSSSFGDVTSGPRSRRRASLYRIISAARRVKKMESWQTCCRKLFCHASYGL